MKQALMPIVLIVFIFSIGGGEGIQVAPRGTPAAAADPGFGSLPLAFIPNAGQVDGPARFYAQTPSYTVWLTPTALVFDSREATGTPPSRPASREVTRIEFLGANPRPVLIAQEPSPGVVNFIRGNDPARWKTGVETSQAVLYRGLYDNIDLKVYGHQKSVEYDWIVNPGGNVRDIRFRIVGASPAALDKEGNLVISARHGEWTHRRPVAYQIVNGKRIGIQAGFRPAANNSFGFVVGQYDASLSLMLDPFIIPAFSTYLGGSKDDAACGLAVSANGGIYAAGYTDSQNFPAAAGYSLKPAGDSDIFIAKFALNGRSLIYSTYVGGTGEDRAAGIALYGNRAIITGSTTSSDFPVRNAFDDELGGAKDGFVLRLHAAGTSLEYSTYLGGAAHDEAAAVAVDGRGSAFVTGYTDSADFPVLVPIFGKQEGREAFVAKLAPNGRSLVYSTFLGGNGEDRGYGIAINGKGGAFVTGWTTSDDFPVLNPRDKSYNGGGDAFVTRIASTGRSLVYSTYLGGGARDAGYGIAISASGEAYVTGQTASPDFPNINAFDKTPGGEDAFVTKLAADGKSLGYSTFLGGSQEDAGLAIAVSADGTASLTGYTMSPDFPRRNAIDNTYNEGRDAFLTKLAATGARLVYSTYLGGIKNDTGLAIALDSRKNTYVVGATGSPNFPLRTAYDAIPNGLKDAFVAKFSEIEMTITGARLRSTEMGMPPDEIDILGLGFGEGQGSNVLLCDGVPVPIDRTISWHDGIITLNTSGWLSPPVYYDHIYEFVIQEGNHDVSNIHSQRFLIPIHDGIGITIQNLSVVLIIGTGFTSVPGSLTLQIEPLFPTPTFADYTDNFFQAIYLTTPIPPGEYIVYLQRGSEIVSEQFPLTIIGF